jgi:hypothetical protein
MASGTNSAVVESDCCIQDLLYPILYSSYCELLLFRDPFTLTVRRAATCRSSLF